MVELLERNLNEIRLLCERHHVAKLEVFGSAADASFDPERSDIDFLVEFVPGQSLGPWMAHYFDLQKDLQDLLGRDVDLVMASSMKNPWFRREAKKTRRTLYAA